MEDRLGLNPLALLRLRWVVEDEPAGEVGNFPKAVGSEERRLRRWTRRSSRCPGVDPRSGRVPDPGLPHRRLDRGEHDHPRWGADGSAVPADRRDVALPAALLPASSVRHPGHGLGGVCPLRRAAGAAAGSGARTRSRRRSSARTPSGRDLFAGLGRLRGAGRPAAPFAVGAVRGHRRRTRPSARSRRSSSCWRTARSPTCRAWTSRRPASSCPASAGSNRRRRRAGPGWAPG